MNNSVILVINDNLEFEGFHFEERLLMPRPDSNKQRPMGQFIFRGYINPTDMPLDKLKDCETIENIKLLNKEDRKIYLSSKKYKQISNAACRFDRANKDYIFDLEISE